MDTTRIPLESDKFYHIYNRGNNSQDIFFEAKNYAYFLLKYAVFLHPIVETYAYCLLKNHFHLLIRIRDEQTIRDYLQEKHQEKSISWNISNAFSSFFQSYAQTINKTYERTGKLFEQAFHRIEVDNDAYFSQMVWYIHFNPQKHHFVQDFKEYPYSSYHSHLAQGNTKLSREEVLQWFGEREAYQKFHEIQHKEDTIKNYIIEFD